MNVGGKHIVPNEVMLNEVSRMINEGHPVTIKVKGVSMLPFIVGGRDSVRLINPSHLKAHDIVLAKITDNHYVLHRIVDITGNQITLMGDGNLKLNESCLVSDVIGKVDAIVRKDKEISPNARFERIKVALWLRLKPFRRWLLAAYRLSNLHPKLPLLV